MYNLIGDMYRPPVVLPPVTFLPDPWLGLTGLSESISSPENGIWVSFPADYASQQFALSRIVEERVLKLQARIFERTSAPEDSEPMPETINFTARNAGVTTILNIEQIFEENFGQLFSVRSNIHCRVFIGVVPEWEIINGGTCRTDFSFTMLVKESIKL